MNNKQAHLAAAQLRAYPDSVFIDDMELVIGAEVKNGTYFLAVVQRYRKSEPDALAYTCLDGSCFGMRYGVEPHEYWSF